jgi:class 3 adenylate cyclase
MNCPACGQANPGDRAPLQRCALSDRIIIATALEHAMPIVTPRREDSLVSPRPVRGRVVDAPGDNLLAEFPTATDAVEAATEIQRVIGARNAAVPEGSRMELRIGVQRIGETRAESVSSSRALRCR